MQKFISSIFPSILSIFNIHLRLGKELLVIRDEDDIIKTVHYSLIRQSPLDKLEKEVLELLKREDVLSLSKIWKHFDCHLWELNYILKRLKEKGLLEERDLHGDNY